jgi:hypothetical protein
MSKKDQTRRQDRDEDDARQPKRPFKEQRQRSPGAFLASNADSPYITGTVLQVMGGETTGG